MTNYPLAAARSRHGEARALAARSGTSLNQFLSTLIAERVGEMKAFAHIDARAARADVGLALGILGQVPDHAPLAGDER